MIGFRVDPDHPKYDIGTKFLVVKTRDRHLVAGQRYIVEGMDRGLSFWKNGSMVYLLRLVHKNGKWYKRQFRMFQDNMEFDLCNGIFEVLKEQNSESETP